MKKRPVNIYRPLFHSPNPIHVIHSNKPAYTATPLLSLHPIPTTFGAEMYVQKIAINIASDADRDALMDEWETLMAHYRNNAQIQGKHHTITQYLTHNTLECMAHTLEIDSLHRKFNNAYVNQQMDALERLCLSKLTFETLGKTRSDYQSACTCAQPDFYILFTHFITIASPLTCGSCFKTVPLYRLPPYNGHDYYDVFSWETHYQACDTLQMGCVVGERWATNQMQQITSTLSKQGLAICQHIEELTGIPTFYFLYNRSRFKGDERQKPCPSCQQQWFLASPLNGFYDLKCDTCQIISTLSMI